MFYTARDWIVPSVEMLLAVTILLTFLSKSYQFQMYGPLHARLGSKGLNLLLQQRTLRILNPHIPPRVKRPSTVLKLSEDNDQDDDGVDDLYNDVAAGPSPRDVFIEALMASLKTKDIQKLYLSENKQLLHDGSKIQFLKSVTGRLIEIKVGLRLQLVYRYTTNDKTKNLSLNEVDEVVRDLLASGFKKAAVTTNKETHELSLKRSAGKLRVIPNANPEEASDGEPNFSHDRKKNVPVDANAAFLKVLIIFNYPLLHSSKAHDLTIDQNDELVEYDFHYNVLQCITALRSV